MSTTFSGAQLRERDKHIEERHKKELDAVERKVGGLKKALERVDQEFFAYRNQCQQLAQALGFSDINEVQRAIDVSDHEATFHVAFERVQVLEDELKAERKNTERLQTRCLELEMELENERKSRLAAEKSLQRTEVEKKDIEAQYDAMRDKSKRAQGYYTRDRRKFFDVWKWLSASTTDKSQRAQDIDLDKLRDRNVQRRKDILSEFGPSLSDLLGLDIVGLEARLKEAHDATEEELRQSLVSSTTASKVSTDAGHEPKPAPLPNRKPLAPLPVYPAPVATTATVKIEPVETPKRKGKKSFLPASSDTEDDSQAPSPSCKDPLVLIPPIASAANSSDTEEDSQAPKLLTSSPDHPPASPFSVTKTVTKRLVLPNLPSRPSFDQAKRSTEAGPSRLRLEIKPEPDEESNIFLDDKRPQKRPRLSLGSSIQTPQPNKPETSISRRVFSTSRVAKEKKLYTDENTPIGKATPIVRMSGQTRLEDYTVYKGRGRYAKEGESSNKTINSLYAINPDRNGGVDHAYEEVVRDKEARMRMDAGDCDECRDWYAAIGPLPTRDRGPLWRSPSTTPVKKRCKHHQRDHTGGGSGSSPIQDPDFPPSPTTSRHHHQAQAQAEIESHKKQISRHRQNWARPRTPPGYWNIGFPDTQEAREINQKAEEMHQRKMLEVERDVERGRWIRR